MKMQWMPGKGFLAIALALGIFSWTGPVSSDPELVRPNILLVVVDDMGYTDLGSYGGEIDTPNLDRLAMDGVRFSDFHTAPTCSPTRAMLLTGTDHHLAGLGNMAEALSPNQKNQPGYEGYLNSRVVTLAELLRDAGYHTYMTGKWHLGLEKSQGPAARGFKKSFALLQGGGGHFDDLGLSPSKAQYREGGELVSLPDDFYSTQFYSDKMIEYIDEGRAQDPAATQRPFFAYLSYTAPHWPLQAPDASIEKYRGRYDGGYDRLYDRRLAGVQSLGLIAGKFVTAPRLPGEPAWNQLGDAEKEVMARKMEIYAAMVDDVDRHVGRVLDSLQANAQLDNTLVIFLSDNGAEGHNLDRDWPPLAAYITGCCDNTLANMGRANSYVWYGPNWARASMAPFHLHKAYTSEGGIRVPAFIRYPDFANRGAIEHGFVSVMDVMPTVLALAGIEHPGTLYRGRDVLPMKGKSMLPLLRGKSQAVHSSDEAMGWEFNTRRAIRRGDWKLVMVPKPNGTGEWRLFNLAADPAEQQDLARERLGIVEEMIQLWDRYAEENGVIVASEPRSY